MTYQSTMTLAIALTFLQALEAKEITEKANGSVKTLTVASIEETQVHKLSPFGPQMVSNVIILRDDKGQFVHTFNNARTVQVESVGPEFWIFIGGKDGLELIIRSPQYILHKVNDFKLPEPKPDRGTEA